MKHECWVVVFLKCFCKGSVCVCVCKLASLVSNWEFDSFNLFRVSCSKPGGFALLMQITFSPHMATVAAAKMLSCSCLQSFKRRKSSVCSIYVLNTLSVITELMWSLLTLSVVQSEPGKRCTDANHTEGPGFWLLRSPVC